jgi:hypothetical protein
MDLRGHDDSETGSPKYPQRVGEERAACGEIPEDRLLNGASRLGRTPDPANLAEPGLVTEDATCCEGIFPLF